MTRRALLAALAAPALPVSPLDCVRRDPCEGDLIEGPNGCLVEVDHRDYEDPFVSYIKTNCAGQRIYKYCTLNQWHDMPDWDVARVVRLGVRG